jgi:hypothetical protein
VLDGKVSVAHASDAYGVVIEPMPAPHIDTAATQRLRGEMRAMPNQKAVAGGEA